ncbi:MAG: tRNA (adenosine(37)-N6)-dimethylallyltransferase MiaA [Clostridia bacterium]|nr:tRNA (adenosine(37)-N6)-dimethylallyltransferase MiaA [Clostridia bacterium]
MKKIPVIAVVGATASGKTAMAVNLAKLFNGEVISADSMQIYKEMNIATAKPDKSEQDGIPHHLIDFLETDEKYSVARFVEDAKRCAKDIYSRGKIPVVAGGTGLYVDSFLENVLFDDEPDNTVVREKLLERRQKEGIDSLFEELKKIDPETASSLHINNEGRIIRALEIYYLTGQTKSERLVLSRRAQSAFSPVYIGLDYKDREKLYSRIDLRVDIMLQNGLLEEAKEYFSIEKNCTAAQAIGYKELAPFFNGEITLEEAVDNLKRATRRYAKRQLTWFRKNKKINWIYCDEYEDYQDILNRASCIIRKHLDGKVSDNGEE